MPTALTHAAAGITSAYVLSGRRDSVLLWINVVLLSVMADFDVIAFRLGIPYGHTFGHRGFFHSILFAFVTSLFFSMVYYTGKGKLSCSFIRLLLVFMLASSLHPLLDMLTSGGLGIGLFIPFSNERLFFPDRPIRVSPIGIRNFFSDWGIRVIKSELRLVILPCCAVILTVYLMRKILIRQK